MNDPDVTASSVLRAVQAEAAGRARTAIRDQLIRWVGEAEDRARGSGSTRPAMTAPARQAAELRRILDRLDRAYPQPGEQWSEVVDVDSVEVWYHDGEPAHLPPEPAPIRIVVVDGAEDVAASAYLSLEQARTHAEDLLRLIAKVEQERAERAATPAEATTAVEVEEVAS